MTTPAQLVDKLNTLDDVQIRGKLSIEELVRRQIERCNISIGTFDQSVFEANVRALLKMLPTRKQEEIMNNTSEFNSSIKKFVFEKWCGVNMGSMNNPVMNELNIECGFPEVPKVQRLPDGTVDWTDPNIMSPRLVEYEETDYEKLYEIILQGLQAVGLTWNIEKKVAEVGGVYKSKVPKALLDPAVKGVVDAMLEWRRVSIAEAKTKIKGAELRDRIQVINKLILTHVQMVY